MTTTVQPAARADNVRYGVLCMLAASLTTALMSLITKLESARYPFGELVFVRSAIAMLPLLVAVWAAGGMSVLRTRRLGGLLARSAAWLVAMTAFIFALVDLPLADATALSYATPLFAALAIPMLGEKVGARGWAAVFLGFVGVLCIARPGDGVINPGAVWALVSAAVGAFAMLGVRQLGKTERGVTITFYTMAFAVPMSLLLAPWTWFLPDRGDILALVGLGLSGGISQLLQTEALRSAPPAIVMPLVYLQLVWAFIFQYAIWGNLPDLLAILGAAIIVATGFYVVTMRK